MSTQSSFREAIQKICGKDNRYPFEAYLFLREALDVTGKMLDKPREGPERHVSGRELIDGIRLYSLQEFGPMARTVLASWGIRSTEDFGEIVFNMVDNGVLGKTQSDSKEDFANGYDFDAAFVMPFLPESAKQPATATARRKPAARNNGAGDNQPSGDKA